MNTAAVPLRRITKTIPLVRASGLVPCVEYLRRLGAPVGTALANAGLSPRVLHRPDALVPLHASLRFVDRAARDQGIDALGWIAGRGSGVETVGLFGAAIRRSFTLFEAIKTAERLVAGHNSGARYWLEEAGDRVGIFRRFTGAVRGSLQADLLTLAYMLKIIGLAGGDGWRATEIAIQGGDATVRIDDEVLSQARIRTGARATGVVVPRVFLSRVLLPTAAVASASPGDLRAWLDTGPPEAFGDSARMLIGSLLEAGQNRVEVAAEAAGLRLRTFQRRLGESGLSYSRLVEEARYAGAIRLLEDPKRKAIDVAYELGYSDPAHFTRAFRRWSSLRPSDYRRLRRAEQGDAAARSEGHRALPGVGRDLDAS